MTQRSDRDEDAVGNAVVAAVDEAVIAGRIVLVIARQLPQDRDRNNQRRNELVVVSELVRPILRLGDREPRREPPPPSLDANIASIPRLMALAFMFEFVAE